MLQKLITTITLSSALGCGAPDRDVDLNSAPGEPLRLVVIGDSISSGVLANTELGDAGDITRTVNQAIVKAEFAYDKYIKGGALGLAEFDKAFQASASLPQLSLYFTKQPWGLRAKLAALHQLTPAQTMVAGVFAWGTRYASVPKMIKVLEQKPVYADGEDRQFAAAAIDYVALSFGGNDYCHGDSAETFDKNLRDSVRVITEYAPQAKLILAKVPNMQRLQQVDHQYKLQFSSAFDILT